MTTTNEFVSINGPWAARASGKFKPDGETPIMAACAPYWVVRYIGGHPYSILHDQRFASEAAAREFAAGLKGGPAIA